MCGTPLMVASAALLGQSGQGCSTGRLVSLSGDQKAAASPWNWLVPALPTTFRTPPPAAWYSADAPSVVAPTSCAPSKSLSSQEPPERTLLIETPSVRIVVSL